METMEKELVKEINELQEKQTWVRKGLQDFLDKWADITAQESIMADSDLWGVFVTSGNEYFPISYWLQAGNKNIVEANSDELQYEAERGKQGGTIQDINNMDMKYIRKIIQNLPTTLERYHKRLQDKNVELNEILNLLQK